MSSTESSKAAVEDHIWNYLRAGHATAGLPGAIKLPTLSALNNNQSALVVTGRTPGSLSQSMPILNFDTRLYDAATLNPKPFESRSLGTSNYQVQLTMRYSF